MKLSALRKLIGEMENISGDTEVVLMNDVFRLEDADVDFDLVYRDDKHKFTDLSDSEAEIVVQIKVN